MARWTHVVIALLSMTGLALAQPDPAQPAQPPPPPAAGPAALGDPAPAAQSKVGGDLAFVLPLGDFADSSYAALGLFGRFELALRPHLFATGRLGFLYHLVKQAPDFDASASMFSLYGGLRYNLAPTGDGLFFLAEAGLNVLVTSFSNPNLGIEKSVTSTKPSVSLGAGFQTGAISARGMLFVAANTSADVEGDSASLYGLMVTVGYDFAAL
jgi:hypothetical protein